MLKALRAHTLSHSHTLAPTHTTPALMHTRLSCTLMQTTQTGLALTLSRTQTLTHSRFTCSDALTHTHASTHAHNVMHTSVHADTYLRRKEGKSTTARSQVETPSLPSNYVKVKAADSRQTLRKSQERTWDNDVQSKEGEGVLRRGTWPA